LSDRYSIKDGRILNRTCEVNIVEHCNLRCRSCTHLSPVLPKHFVDPGALSADLTTLAGSYRVNVLKILGGEPLLHPDLPAVVLAARKSQVAEKLEIWTNGLLLPRMERRVWETVDSVRISLYPGRSLKQHQLDRCIDLAHQHNVPLRGMLLGQEATYRNGIKIDDAPDFRDRLLSYLKSPEPLPACRNCLGSSGKWFEHQQVGREEFRQAQGLATEDLIHPRLVGTARLALARAESLLPRTVVNTAEHVMRSSDPLVGLLRKLQAFNSSRFSG